MTRLGFAKGTIRARSPSGKKGPSASPRANARLTTNLLASGWRRIQKDPLATLAGEPFQDQRKETA